MRLGLNLHPDSRCPVVAGIDVDVSRPRGGALVLRYLVTGRIGALRLPPAAASARADELWLHTCFEAFVRPVGGEGYYELNFAPSTEWAAYRFSGYRTGMAIADESVAPIIGVVASAERFELQASLELPNTGSWRLALSAVIEHTNGERSYWALAHPSSKPDFHHPDAFALELTAGQT